MRKSYLYFVAWLIACVLSISVLAQNVTLTGSIKNSSTKETLPAVSVVIKGTSQGTFTDSKGDFKLTVAKLPVTLVISSVGLEDKEISVSDATPIDVELSAAATLGQEVVVAATRTPQRILESPVSIERMSSRDIRNVAVPTYYDAVANLKGVDLTTSSFAFRTPSTRGFNGSGNLRLNQLVDGMDNQAPALNFAVGSIVGLSSLDVDNMELLPGASSALYGSGGMNGTLLITSKNPFKYQGFSAQVKEGIMHISDPRHSATPYHDLSFWWGKKVSDKFAFKIGSEYVKANDWVADDKTNLARNNVLSNTKPGSRTTDPNYDGVNVFGDEASASMNAFAQAAVFQGSQAFIDQYHQATGMNPTPEQIAGFLQTNPNTAPFYLGLQNNIYGNQYVSRTGYDEADLVDYNTYNLKVSGGLYYKLNSNTEASLTGNWGMGSSVYTGADRYSLKNFTMGQYRLEVRSSNWFVRAYTTQENSGDSYASTISALSINNAWKPDAQWFGEYVGNYSGAVLTGMDAATAHGYARSKADSGRYLPGSTG